MRRVKFAPLAEEEAADAAEWYEARRPGLGEDFLSAIRRAVEQLRAFSLSGTSIHDQARKATVRRLLVSGFPYALCYVVFDSHVQVLAVAHTRRLPGYWLGRRRSARPTRRR